MAQRTERLFGLPERPRHAPEPTSHARRVSTSPRPSLRPLVCTLISPHTTHSPNLHPVQELPYAIHAPRSPVISRTMSAPSYDHYGSPMSPSVSLATHDLRALVLDQHGLAQDGDDRRHVCDTCGKAFNRPSSLAIHVHTHTGEKRQSPPHITSIRSLTSVTVTAYACPFPGCGRRFNVNSNMRRHLRNHSSPSARSNNLTPYTYPLTTVPRNYSFLKSSPAISSWSPASSVSSSPRAPRRDHFTDSENESDQSPDGDSQYGEDVEEASGAIQRLRLRSRSSPGVRRPYHLYQARNPDTYSTPLGPQRSRSRSCTQPGCQCNLPAALHPSDSARLLSK